MVARLCEPKWLLGATVTIIYIILGIYIYIIPTLHNSKNLFFPKRIKNIRTNEKKRSFQMTPKRWGSGVSRYIYIFFMLIIKNSLHCFQARRLNEVAKDKDAEFSLSQRLDDGWLDGWRWLVSMDRPLRKRAGKFLRNKNRRVYFNRYLQLPSWKLHISKR